MFDSWFLIAIALGYVGALFAVAWAGDRMIRLRQGSGGRPLIYAMSISVYCTSWTIFGSVGLAATTGYDFIPVYLGPMLMFVFGSPLLLSIIRLSKSQNLTSAADFLAARYGKSQAVAAVVTLVMIAGSLPYIALQLKAISVSIETLLGGGPLAVIPEPGLPIADTALLITLSLAVFAILFGTRHIDATEHQDGLMLAIAVESVVKLVALTAVGLFILFSVFHGPFDFWTRASTDYEVSRVFTASISGGKWLTVTLLSLVCVILLPRQFHVIVVENNAEREVRRARWLFPLYLIGINLFMIPIAAAGLMLLQRGAADPDFFVLTLPMQAGSRAISLAAFIGGLSAATAMVIVEVIALSIMVGNGLVLPLVLRQRIAHGDERELRDLSGVLLLVRRAAIPIILLCAYGVYRALAQSNSLVSIGLISFAAIAQLAPAFFGGLMWRGATARGAIAGILTGFAVWTYTLLLPWIAKAGYVPDALVRDGPYGISALRPEELLFLQFDPLSHAVFWSLATNIAAYVVVSLLRAPEPIERLQAQIFIPDNAIDRRPARSALRGWKTSLTLQDLERAAARYLGAERARQSFAAFSARRALVPDSNGEKTAGADVQAIRFTEHLLTSAVGAASARLIMSLLLRRDNVSPGSAMRLLDDANEALQFNRDLLQSAMDQVRHGLAVFDKDMRLICWNRQFHELLDLPEEFVQLNLPLDTILRVAAARAGLESPILEAVIGDRVLKLAVHHEIFHERELSGDKILEVRASPMPQGGIVITFFDITQQVASDAALSRSNETLERRVGERTRELLQVNTALEEAKAAADEASLDKTRFIAAASHDILQPLNAARLYAASLVERPMPGPEGHLVRNLDASLSAVEEILSALIEVSRMDAGRLDPDIEAFALAPMLDRLRSEFEPLAREKGLVFTVLETSAWVQSDRRLLRRVLQNLIGNAIKYTARGRVLVGTKLRGNKLSIGVFDTGPGIPENQQSIIFKEFHRLAETAGTERGVGLGLSIVERICRVLKLRLDLVSAPGKGSMFAVNVPLAALRGVAAGRTVTAAPGPGSFAGVRVLCLDNEPAVLSGMEALLKGWNCTIELAGSAEAAISRRIGFPSALTPWPDVILADYHLDTGTGVEAIKRLREAAGVEIPAMIISADHSTPIQRQIREHGFVHLRKPLKPAALRSALAHALMQRARAVA